MTYQELLEEVQRLSHEEQRALLQLLASTLEEEVQPAPSHSLLELEGVGAALWRAQDAQQYVDSLRQEWDERP